MATTQPEFLNNFLQLFNNFSIDHESLNATSGAGTHNVIHLVEQEGAVQTDAGEISVYTKNIVGVTDQVFLRYQGNGQEFAYTCYQIYGLTPLATHHAYFTFLPGNILLYFGDITFTTNASTLNLYPPIAKKIFSISICEDNTTPEYKLTVALEESSNNFFYVVKFNAPQFGQIINNKIFYMVLANI